MHQLSTGNPHYINKAAVSLAFLLPGRPPVHLTEAPPKLHLKMIEQIIVSKINDGGFVAVMAQ